MVALRAPSKPGKGVTVAKWHAAAAVVDAHGGVVAGRATRRDRERGHRRNDVDERHQAVVFVVQAVTVDDVGAGELRKLATQRELAWLDDGFAGTQERRGHVRVVLEPLLNTGCGPPRRIDDLHDLEVVDVDVDRMLVVVVVDERPLLDGTEARLQQRRVGKRVVVELVDERLRILVARVLVPQAA
jgi:hypothetical protein